MPNRAPRPCTHPMCKHYATKGSRCDKHQREAWETSKGKSRHERGYGSEWDKRRKRIMVRDGYLCQTCKRAGLTVRAHQVDHIINKASGGTDEDGNLEAICRECHKLKTQREAQQAQRRTKE